ncbi:SIR2 family protein [Magnetospirillum sp. 15-1]|uniref:SIR2 family protein n=1 Tax=Magnetospirillum sp. 15-1 TaxID=1979370 RepID=UPI000BBC1C58|nr:SIR2 family protein [Magnetospirillum sp. 15-1]
MNMPDSWHNEVSLIDHLATQLLAGRLGLFLGAGVSRPFGLPDWDTLVSRMAVAAGEAAPVAGSFNATNKVEALALKYFTTSDLLKGATKAALYQGVALDFAKISGNRLLAAIGSLVMASRRGTAAKVITLNFDDLLELYLEYHGFTTATMHDGCHWAQNADVVVYHPHGFLPLGHDLDSKEIVLGTTSFHKIMQSDLWRPILETALRQHTFLYLGLSGEDMHLHSHWATLKDVHAIAKDRICYHGVRFTTGGGDDDLSVVTQGWGIHTHSLTSYDELPDFLFRICQEARVKRMAMDV